MREIKFRIWDDSVSKYIKWEDIQNNYNMWNILEWDRHHYTPEQYTGLKDINGVEIYEGDILKHKYASLKNWIVSFRNGQYGITNEDNHDFYQVEGSNFFVDREVVGNIHQGVNNER